MKRFFGISLLVCIANAFLYARTPQEAAQIASRFLSQSHSAPEQRMQRVVAANGLEAPVNLVYTHYQADHTTPAIFVFNHSTEEGFVLVSAENNARAVLGYSDYGHIDYTDIPENMQFWFNMYAHEMARSVAVSTTGMQRVGTPINEPLPNIEPILGETIWGQGQPFNNLCPVINGARSVAGCVATAISQIMYAHKYPEKGSGSHSYRIGKEITISEDFSQTIYDWDNMLPSYRKQYTEQEATAVATLIYHTGVASSMSYHPQGSGAVSEWALQAIHTYFGYDAAIKPLLKDYLMESEILKTVASELQEGRPIYVSGRTTKDEGHAFVCDGIHADGYVHINWGWDGVGNGFYALSALDPGQQGVGGSSDNLAFTEEVKLYTNIRPDQGGEAEPYLYARAQQTSKARIARDEKVTFHLENIGDAGTANIDGYIGYYIYDNQQRLVESLPLQRIKLRPGYIYTELDLSANIASQLASGTYSLIIGSVDEHQVYRPVLLHAQGYPQYTFTLTSDSILFDVKNVELPNALQVDLINKSGSNQWQIDMYSPGFWQSTANDEWLIRCTFTSNSPTSVIGTYLLENPSNTPGNINLAGAVCAIGNITNNLQYILQDLQLTITETNEQSLALQFMITFNGKTYIREFVVDNPKWYQEKAGDYQDYNSQITFDPATPLKASKAITLSKLQPDAAPIRYLVEGYLVELTHASEDIATFNISDDGEDKNTLHCDNISWLEENTSEDLHSGDKLVLLGQFTYDNYVTTMQGDIYQHTPTTYMPIISLDISIDEMQAIFTWESEAPYYQIRITNQKGKILAETISDKKTITAKMPNTNKHTFYLRPMLADKTHFAGAAEVRDFKAGISTATGTVNADCQYIIYDLMGNKLGTTNNKPSLPQGVYMLVGTDTKKIFIP